MLPLGNVSRKHNTHFHCCSDDSQLYLSFKPDETSLSAHHEKGINDVKHWMTTNFLLLKSDKKEMILLGHKKLTNKLRPHS